MEYSFLLTQTFLFQDADLHGSRPIPFPCAGPHGTAGSRAPPSPRMASCTSNYCTPRCLCVCVYLCLGWDLGHCLSREKASFIPTTCRLPAGRADRSKTLSLRQMDRRKENAGTRLVKRGENKQLLRDSGKKKIHSKLTK